MVYDIQLWPSSKEHPHFKGFSYMGLGAKSAFSSH